MKLTKKVIGQLKEPTIRLLLCQELGMTDQTIMDYIRNNKDNGPLTTYAALSVIREETGLSDSEILEPNKKKALSRAR